MPNESCRLLSNGYKIDYNNNSLRLRPCCLFSEHVEILDHNLKDITDYRNRISQIDSYTYPGCHQCNFQEKQNLRKTWRQASFDIVPDDAEPGQAYYLEIQVDNVCNGGCVTCGPWNSSYWHSEMLRHNIPVTPVKHENQLDKILNLIDIQKPRRILFLGGEPFLSDVDQKILPLIKHPELVELQYTTNGSIYPSQDRIEHWKNFKSVMINFSIDGIGSRFEYIRYPLKWHTVQTNMFNMRTHMPDNVQFKINHTINILNLYYWQEFETWCFDNYTHDRLGREIRFNFNPAAGILSPKSATKQLHARIIEKYGQDSKPSRAIINTVDSLDNVLHYLHELDQRRNQDWREVFTEIADWL